MNRSALFMASALASLTAVSAAAQVGPAHPVHPDYVPGEYRVFTGGGEPATLDAVVAAMDGHDVVFVGESHDDPTAHMLEEVLLERAWTEYMDAPSDGVPQRSVALSLEFFERDVQLVLDEYLDGLISESAFRGASRPWPRYETDYRELIEFSKERGLAVIAANAPRRYATRVTQHGRDALEALSARAREYLPPLPYGQPSVAYRDQWIQAIATAMEQEGIRCGVPVSDPSAPVGSHDNMGNQLHSQVLWDASMGWRIAQHLDTHPDALVLHMSGAFHVGRGTGTPEHLTAYRPATRYMIVMLRPVDDVEVFEPAPEGAWGDFVIQTEKAQTLEAIECRDFEAGH